MLSVARKGDCSIRHEWRKNIQGLHSGGQFAEVDLMKLFTQQINVHGGYAENKGEFEGLVKFVDENQIYRIFPVLCLWRG